MKLPALLLLAAGASASRTQRAAGLAARLPRASLLSAALDAVASAGADAELGGDLAVVEASGRRSMVMGEPATLSEYCSGGKEGASKGMRVQADWMDMGAEYPGEIDAVHKDGTVDVSYDDGFDEEHVPMSRVKITEEQIDTSKDPACQLQDFTVKLKEKVTGVRKLIGWWIEDKTRALAEVSGLSSGKAKEKKRDKAAKADGHWKGGKDPEDITGTATKQQTKELERLKEQLSEKDLEIEELEKDLRETDEDIDEERNKDAAPKSMDDLIAMYKARIAERDGRINKLKGELDEKKKKLASLRDPKTSKKDRATLEGISNRVEELSKEIDKAREKAARLEAKGGMDPELDHSLKSLFRWQEKLEDQMRELQRLQSRLEERKEAARRAAIEAEEKARKEAEDSGDDPVTVERKARKAREDAERAADDLDTELLTKARDVSRDLDEVQKSVQELDSGVHPHGNKWWRFRYEHAYVEAILMILICFLMLFWERIYQYARWKVYGWSNANEHDRVTHGTMYIGWLEFLAGELMTSLFVFLTCWVLAECNAFEMFPVLLQGSQQLHLPTSGLQYRRMALDVCVVLFFAILFYYALTFSVVHSCTKKLLAWAELEMEGREREEESATCSDASAGPTPRKEKRKAKLLRFIPKTTLGMSGTMGSAEAKANYESLKSYFFSKVHSEPALVKQLEVANIGEFSEQTFPFWVYMRLGVRDTSDKLLRFGLPLWACLIVTFVGLLFLHRFAHMGCVRIMAVSFFFLMALFALMVWWISTISSPVSANAESASDVRQSGTVTPRASTAHAVMASFHQRFSTEEGVIFCLHFLLFFTCYLAARMICQPWMWRLHFWLVLTMTCLLVFLGMIFVYVVAPMIPDFCVALSMPPYVDPSDVRTMLEAIAIAKHLGVEELQHSVEAPNKYKMGRSKRSSTINLPPNVTG